MPELAELSAEERERALSRFRLLAPHLESGRELRTVADGSGVCFRTLQRWVAQYRKSGLAALGRKSRRDRGERRAVSPTVRKAIEGLALESATLPMTSIYRQVHQFARSVGEPLPSYWMVRDLVNKLPSSLLTLAHRGAKVYGESFDLVHRREASMPNAIWQADHAQLDILLLKGDGNAARPWLTIVIDDYSRAIAGYYLGFDPPSSLRTCLALRQGMSRKEHPHWHICGIPSVLYVDNGSDFTSNRLEQVAADLKIRLVFSIPGKPQGRGRVERFFRTINEMFLCDLEGYTGKGRRKPGLTLGQLDERFRTFLLDIYHRRRSSRGRLAPTERWEEGGFLPRMPESLEQLDLLLMQEVRARKIRRDGIHFQGLRYLSLTLAAYVGEEATIRFDPRDLGEIRVFYKDRFLCRAISAELAGETIPLRDLVRVRNQRRKELRSILLDRQKMVDTLLLLKKGPTTEEPDKYHSPQPEQQPASSDTVTSSQTFVETLEHKRFIEFCDACRRFRYIGLCYGPPGIGKTLSAIRYSRNEMIVQFDRWTAESLDQLPIDTIFYTASVINTPSRIETDIDRAHERLMGIALRPLRREAAEVLDAIRLRDEARRGEVLNREGCSPCERPPVDPTYFQTFEHYEARKRTVPNPATLILVDEADRLQMNSLEQLRSIFDKGTAGLILIGMPGIEKRITRFPQFYSRIGFVHEFRPLDSTEMHELLERRWVPVGVTLPHEPLLPEVIARLIRMTGGNFRLLTRLLIQIERVLEVNQLLSVSTEVVEAARDSLVIGQG